MARDLNREMELMRLKEINDAGRGNHNTGMYSPYSGGSSLTSGDRIVSGSSFRKKGSGRYLGNGQYVED